MTRSNDLNLRISIERKIIQKKFPGFEFSYNNPGFKLTGWCNTTSGKMYELKLILSEYYPDQCPKLYIVTPKILPTCNGLGSINDHENSHKFHTQSNDNLGYIQICHYGPMRWNSAFTCIGVLFKGILWLTAYEQYLQVGTDINTIVNQWKGVKNG